MKLLPAFYNHNPSNRLVFFAGILLGISAVRFFAERSSIQTEMITRCVAPNWPAFHGYGDNGSLAVKNSTTYAMAKKVRVFGMILTMPKNKHTKAVHVKATWARRLDGFVFISSEEDTNLPSIRAVTDESQGVLWEKTRQALTYAYSNGPNNYDFFLKADDDTYMIVENIRLLLAKHDSEIPILIGRRFKKHVKQGYVSGGAGYIISRAALKMIVEGMKNGVVACDKRGGPEDINLGLCAEAVNVTLVDSLDEHGYEIFHPLNPKDMLNKEVLDKTKWLHNYNYFPLRGGFECCSDHSVSFHYVPPNEMFVLEFLIYHLHPHGIVRNTEQYLEFTRLKNLT